jgi:hypothetical protein
MRKPSTTTNPGRGTRDITASRIALSDARWMLIRSISSASMTATLHAIAASTISGYSAREGRGQDL